MIGILMLDTAFPRLVGDVGNPKSFDFPVTYAVVPGATPQAIVVGDAEVWADQFIAAGKDLVARGCTGLTTTCGFLTLLRDRVAEETGVPVVSSALELVPQLLAAKRTPGVLTISAASLSARHLAAAGVPSSVPIVGVDGSHFATAILGNSERLDASISETELVQAAEQLIAAHSGIDVIVLECTNMPPHQAAIEAATGCEVVSINTAMRALHRPKLTPAQ